MNKDLANDYSVKQWVKVNQSLFPSFWKRILLPTFAFTVLMIAIMYLTSSGELRIPVNNVELRSEEFYESSDLDVRYEQKKTDAKPMLYAKKKIDLLKETMKWFVVGLVVSCTTAATTKKTGEGNPI